MQHFAIVCVFCGNERRVITENLLVCDIRRTTVDGHGAVAVQLDAVCCAVAREMIGLLARFVGDGEEFRVDIGEVQINERIFICFFDGEDVIFKRGKDLVVDLDIFAFADVIFLCVGHFGCIFFKRRECVEVINAIFGFTVCIENVYERIVIRKHDDILLAHQVCACVRLYQADAKEDDERQCKEMERALGGRTFLLEDADGDILASGRERDADREDGEREDKPVYVSHAESECGGRKEDNGNDDGERKRGRKKLAVEVFKLRLLEAGDEKLVYHQHDTAEDKEIAGIGKRKGKCDTEYGVDIRESAGHIAAFHLEPFAREMCRENGHGKGQNANADDDGDVGVCDLADHMAVNDTKENGDPLEEIIASVSRACGERKTRDDGEDTLCCFEYVVFLAIEGGKQNVGEDKQNGKYGKNDDGRMVINDGRHIQIGEEDSGFFGIVEQVEVIIVELGNEIFHDLRLLRKITCADVFGAIVLRVVVFAVHDVCHIDALVCVLEGREVRIVGHGVIHQGRNGAGEDAFVDLGEELDGVIIVFCRFKHDECAVCASGLEIGDEFRTLDNVVKARELAHERLGAVKTVFFAVDKAEYEVVCGIELIFGIITNRFEHRRAGNAVIGRALSHRDGVEMSHEHNGVSRFVGRCRRDMYDDVFERPILIAGIGRNVFLYEIGRRFGRVFVYKSPAFKLRCDILDGFFVGFLVGNGARSVFGKLFNVCHDVFLAQPRFLLQLLRIDDGYDEKEAEDQTQQGGYDFLRFGHSQMLLNRFF